MTTPCSRSGESRLIRLCPEEGTWQDKDDIPCAWDHYGERKHRVVRALICSVCLQAYRKRKEFDSHECYSAY